MQVGETWVKKTMEPDLDGSYTARRYMLILRRLRIDFEGDTIWLVEEWWEGGEKNPDIQHRQASYSMRNILEYFEKVY